MISGTNRDVRENEIRTRSYFMWENEGRPEGRHLEHRLRAQAELEAEDKLKKPRAKAGKTAPGARGKRSKG